MKPIEVHRCPTCGQLVVSKKKYIKTPQLCKMLGVNRMTLNNWESSGNFTPPRMGKRGDRVFTEKQVEEIIKAFKPGGSRQWHFSSNDL